MKHRWQDSLTWSQVKTNLRNQIIRTFKETRSRVVYEDLREKTGLSSYELDLLLCQICAMDYQLGRARADTVVCRRNKLMPEDGYFLFRLNLKKLSRDQNWENFYEAELRLCCHEFGIELKPGCIQLELWKDGKKRFIPLKEIEKRSPDLLKSLRHSGRRYKEAIPSQNKFTIPKAC